MADQPWGQLITMNLTQSDSLQLVKHQISIGRSLDNVFQLQDNRVSSQHCLITKDGAEIRLKDLSTNGTYIGDSKIGKGNEVVLKNGDKIFILHKDKVQVQHTLGFTFLSKPESQITPIQPEIPEIPETPQEVQAVPPPSMTETPQIQESKCLELDLLGEEIICSICSGYLYQAVYVNPCQHHFCGGCLASWAAKQKTCPNCRIDLGNVQKATMINNIIDKYLSVHPERKRTEAEYQVLRDQNIYYNQPLEVSNNDTKQNNKQQQLQQDEEEDYEDEQNDFNDDEHSDADEDEDGEFVSNDSQFEQQQQQQHNLQLGQQLMIGQYLGQPLIGGGNQLFGQPRNNLFQNVGGFNQWNQQWHQGQINNALFQNQLANNINCKCCEAEFKGYKCVPLQQHVGCSSCGRMMPRRELTEDENLQLKMHCQICKQYNCKYFYGDCRRAIANQITMVHELELGAQMQMCLQVNNTEVMRIRQHLKGQNTQHILTFMLDNYISKGLFYFIQDKTLFNNPLVEINCKIMPDTVVCWLCHKKLISQIVLRYVQAHKYDEHLFMMEDCWFGINCRRQTNPQHAQQFNHMCEQTKFI